MGQYNNAIPTLGGDVKKLKCKGNSLKSDDNFTVALDTLKNCSETIKKNCEKALPTGLEANIEKCNKLAEEFRAEYRKQLIQASEDKICTNAEKLNAQWAAVESACEKDFNVTKAELSQLEEKTACVKAFVICRKEERRQKRANPEEKQGTKSLKAGGEERGEGGMRRKSKRPRNKKLTGRIEKILVEQKIKLKVVQRQ